MIAMTAAVAACCYKLIVPDKIVKVSYERSRTVYMKIVGRASFIYWPIPLKVSLVGKKYASLTSGEKNRITT